MITPGKFITFKQSTLAKLSLVLDSLDEPREVRDLLEANQGEFASIAEFLHALDALYALGRIELCSETWVLSRAS